MLFLLPLLSVLAAGAPPVPPVSPVPPPATYVVRLTRTSPPAFTVSANWPGGQRLAMDTTRPGDLPELLEGGWPALVTRLRVADAAGRAVAVSADGAAGWRLPEGQSGPLSAEYEVETRLLAANGWPAPREAVFTEEDVISIVGRALFVTTDALQSSTVKFELPAGWRPYAPWDVERDGVTFPVRTAERLRENLVVLSRLEPEVVEAGGFRLIAFPMGAWRQVSPEIEKTIRAHARFFVKLMAFEGRETYLAVLLPIRDRGAESYRQSLALTFPEEPSRANQAAWGNLLGHEVFHFWNGWLLYGADYPSSQWFQEGFTEYTANVLTVAAGLMTPAEFRDKLGGHVANYRRLATSLEAPGNRKGPPLYSGGALVAFAWDGMIREKSGSTRGLGDFLRSFSKRCEGGARPWVRDDLVAAMNETAEGDWAAFLDAHVPGTKPLPLAEIFGRAGLRLTETPGGAASVTEDPNASRGAIETWRRITRGK